MKYAATVERARQLRRDQSNAEKLFWSKARNRQLGDWKFRRQVPVGPYIVDFLVTEAKLVIELDGEQHAEALHAIKDRARDTWLENNGYTVMRFWNNQVYENLPDILDKILFELNAISNE